MNRATTIALADMEPLAALIVKPMYLFGHPFDFIVVDANDTATRALDPDNSMSIGGSIARSLSRYRTTGILQMYIQVAETGEPISRRGIEVHTTAGELHRVWDGVLVPFGELVLAVFHDVTAEWLNELKRAEAITHETLLRERDRMARDLHDTVLQDVIAASMVLARIASYAPGSTADEIQDVIDIHDEAVGRLRAVLYDLRQQARGDLRRQLLDTLDLAAPALGFTPTLTFAALPPGVDQVAHHLVSVLSETLANVARHARATRADVDLRVADDHLVLTVADDGVGIDPAADWGFGLHNLYDRSRLVGGSCEVTSAPGTGTTVRCRVPMPRARPGGGDAGNGHASNGASSEPPQAVSA